MRNPVGRRLAAAVAVVIALTDCTGDTHPRGYAAGVFFPTYPRSPEGVYPSALLADVKLVEESGCLLGEGRDGGRSLLLWPDGYAPVRRDGNIVVIDEDGNVVAEEGRRDSFGGGTSGIGDARYKTGNDIPVRCRVAGDGYWQVTPESA
jgi:hypothetical protein